MKTSSIKVKGIIELVCRDKDGNVKWRVKRHNLIMNVGKAAMAGLVGNTGGISAFSYLAVGSSNTAVANTQTALAAEITTNGLARVSATASRITTTSTNDTLQFVTTWNVSGSQVVEEIGVFNAASVGIMLGRALTGSKSMVSGDQLTGTYQIVFS